MGSDNFRKTSGRSPLMMSRTQIYDEQAKVKAITYVTTSAGAARCSFRSENFAKVHFDR